MRFAVLTKMCLGAAAAALLIAPISTVQAQQYNGSRNSRISTVGDLAVGRINPKINRLTGLNFSTMGLFGDAEGNNYIPYIFQLPELGLTGTEFKGVTYQEYLDTVAGLHSIRDSQEYLNRFSSLNQLSYRGELLLFKSTRLSAYYDSQIEAKWQEFRDQAKQFYGSDDLSLLSDADTAYINEEMQALRLQLISALEPLAPTYLHEEDFLNGGGYLPIPDESITPTPSTDPVFTPLFPLLDNPVTPAGAGDAATEAEVSSVNTETNDVLNSITEQDPEAGQTVGEILAAQSTSQGEQQAPAVAAVPEPATLALMTLGAAAGLIRPRRR